MMLLGLTPVSIYLFSLKYYRKVTELVCQNRPNQGLYAVIEWVSYASVFCLITEMAIYQIFYLRSRWSQLITEFIVEIFSCYFLGITLFQVKRFCGQLAKMVDKLILMATCCNKHFNSILGWQFCTFCALQLRSWESFGS